MLPIFRLIPVGGVLLAIAILLLALNPPRAASRPALEALAPARGPLMDRNEHPEWRQFLILAALRRADEVKRLRDLHDTVTHTPPAVPTAPEAATAVQKPQADVQAPVAAAPAIDTRADAMSGDEADAKVDPKVDAATGAKVNAKADAKPDGRNTASVEVAPTVAEAKPVAVEPKTTVAAALPDEAAPATDEPKAIADAPEPVTATPKVAEAAPIAIAQKIPEPAAAEDEPKIAEAIVSTPKPAVETPPIADSAPIGATPITVEPNAIVPTPIAVKPERETPVHVMSVAPADVPRATPVQAPDTQPTAKPDATPVTKPAPEPVVAAAPSPENTTPPGGRETTGSRIGTDLTPAPAAPVKPPAPAAVKVATLATPRAEQDGDDVTGSIDESPDHGTTIPVGIGEASSTEIEVMLPRERPPVLREIDLRRANQSRLEPARRPAHRSARTRTSRAKSEENAPEAFNFFALLFQSPDGNVTFKPIKPNPYQPMKYRSGEGG